MINFANALHGLTDDEKVRLFRHRPTMLEWYEKVAAVTDRVTDFLQSAQSANNYPAGTTDRPDKEDDAWIAKAKAIPTAKGDAICVG